MRVGLSILLVALGTAWAAPAPAGAQVPATLTGEVLRAEPITAERGCPSGRFTRPFSVEGVAAGPYPGTFTEQGTITINPPTTESFQATFEIVSGTTRITGTKTGSGVGFPSGICENPVQYSALVGGTYQARIETPTGTFTDQGTTQVNFIVNDFPLPSETTTHDFTETFQSNLGAPIPVLPPPGDDDEDEDDDDGGEDD